MDLSFSLQRMTSQIFYRTPLKHRVDFISCGCEGSCWARMQNGDNVKLFYCPQKVIGCKPLTLEYLGKQRKGIL